MQEKIVEFVKAHGYTYKSFFLSMALFPPAAGYIGYRMPGTGPVQRIVLAALGVLTSPVVVTATLYAVGHLVPQHVR